MIFFSSPTTNDAFSQVEVTWEIFSQIMFYSSQNMLFWKTWWWNLQRNFSKTTDIFEIQNWWRWKHFQKCQYYSWLKNSGFSGKHWMCFLISFRKKQWTFITKYCTKIARVFPFHHEPKKCQTIQRKKSPSGSGSTEDNHNRYTVSNKSHKSVQGIPPSTIVGNSHWTIQKHFDKGRTF